MDLNQIWDTITIASLAANGILTLCGLLVWKYSWDVTITWIIAGIKNLPIFIRWTTERKYRFDMAAYDITNPKIWKLKKKTQEIPYEVKGVALGPSRNTMMLIADEHSSGIDIDELLHNQASGATPAYVQAYGDVNYVQGFKKGFNKATGGVLDWVGQNIGTIAILAIIMLVFVVVGYDKVVEAPKAWATANKCEQQKSLILAKVGNQIDLSDIGYKQIEQPKPSNTGGRIDG